MLLSGSAENQLLATLPPHDLEALRPHLRTSVLPRGAVLFRRGDRISEAYFPYRGAVSLIVRLATGETIESGMVGRNGVLGGFAALDPEPASCDAVVQVEMAGAVIDIETLAMLASARRSICTLLLRHQGVLLTQAQKIAACNAVHGMEARFCRWLLAVREASESRRVTATQDGIAALLGVRRTSVCLIAHNLQQAGVIRTRRGLIDILDEGALRNGACPCHADIASHYASFLKPTEVQRHHIEAAPSPAAEPVS